MKPYFFTRALLVSLSATTIMSGCVMDFESGTTTTTTGTVDVTPSLGGTSIDYVISYPSKGLTTMIAMDSLDKAQGILDSFILAYSLEAKILAMSTELSEAEEGTFKVIGACDGPKLTTGILNSSAASYDNEVTYTNYCSAEAALNTHAEENGVVTANGTKLGLTMRMFGYTWEATNIVKLSLGGEFYRSLGDAPTLTLQNVVINEDTKNLTAKFNKLKITTYADGNIYTGNVYHPTYGNVLITTKTRVLTAEDSKFGTRPTSGEIIFTGTNSTANILFTSDTGYTINVDMNKDGTTDITDARSWP